MRRFLTLLVAVVVVAVPLHAAVTYADALTPPETMAPTVLVGLFWADEVSLTCRGPFLVEFSSGSSSYGANSVVKFRANGNKVLKETSGGTVTEEGAVEVSPAQKQSGAYITVQSHTGADTPTAGLYFEGSILVMAQDGRLCVANLVDVESYVRSVVSSEMPDGWPVEALKAQAVAVRSYLAYKVKMTNTPGLGLPVSGYRSVTPGSICIWATDQVYKGVSVQRPNAVAASQATRGQILTYGGLPAAAYFHAASEGKTENVRNVWGGNVPYLVSVDEIPYESPYHSWSVSFSGDSLGLLLAPLGVSGSCVSLEGCDPGDSGRWGGITVCTGSGEVWVKGTDFRKVLGQPLRSLLFSVYTVGGGKNASGCVNPGMPVWVAGKEQVTNETAGELFLQGGGGIISKGTSGLSVLSGTVSDGPVTFVFEGKGWGHGVGMSQWGARALALAGADYPAILNRYFPGTALELWW